MAKKVINKIKLAIEAGKATPAPPVGTALGPAGINIGDFCSQYNEQTRDRMGDILPVEITIYDDRSFDFIIKTPPASFLLKKAAKLEKGSGVGANEHMATITQDQVREIAEIKLPDLNAYGVEEAMRIIEGTAKNMGIAIKGVNDQELKEQAKEAAAEAKEQAILDAKLDAQEEANQEALESQAEVIEEETEESE